MSEGHCAVCDDHEKLIDSQEDALVVADAAIKQLRGGVVSAVIEVKRLTDALSASQARVRELEELNRNFGKTAQENERLRSDALRARDFECELFRNGQACKAVIQKAQNMLTEYLPPDSGISDREVVNRLLALLDGPEARAALSSKGGEE